MAAPPSGVSKEAISSFFARFGPALTTELRGLIQRFLEPVTFRAAVEQTLVHELLNALRSGIAVSVLVRHAMKHDRFFKFEVAPVAEGVRITARDEAAQSTLLPADWALDQLLAAIPQVVGTASAGTIWSVSPRTARLDADRLRAEVEAHQARMDSPLWAPADGAQGSSWMVPGSSSNRALIRGALFRAPSSGRARRGPRRL